jgi:hypothetical protein
MIRLEDNIQNGLNIPRILHILNKNGSTDSLGQIALSAESRHQKYHTSSGEPTFDERFL